MHCVKLVCDGRCSVRAYLFCAILCRSFSFISRYHMIRFNMTRIKEIPAGKGEGTRAKARRGEESADDDMDSKMD